jgi:hypothetical protein
MESQGLIFLKVFKLGPTIFQAFEVFHSDLPLNLLICQQYINIEKRFSHKENKI